jgi:predicted enzyme related to lactoylglutathione lyase
MANTATKTAAPVVHFEIGCRNSEATAEFYRSVFSWSINAMGPANMIAAADQGIGGHITSLGHEPHNYVTVYIRVPRIEDYLEQIEAHGGKRVVGPVPIPTGRFAWFNDPEGNLLGLFDDNPQ